MTRGRALLEGALAGAAVSLALWGVDVGSLGALSFAGVSDAEAQRQLLEVTLPSVVSLEGRLASLHLVAGLVAGALAAAALGPSSRRRRLAVAAGLSLALHALAVAGMMGRYPQLYADRWWLVGGVRAAVQRAASHLLGPRAFDAVFLLVLSVASLAAAFRAVPLVRRLPRRALQAAAAVASILLVAGAGLSAVGGAPARSDPPLPSVLLLVVDSLRTDRLESADVMPETSRLVGEGTLFRHAFTPVARTFPSWVSLLTGREPRETGVRTMFPSVESRRDLGPTFASELRDRGYRTFVVSDFAGDIFPRIRGGFDVVDAPHLTADRLARSTVLAAHGWSLPLLRLAPLRDALPEWRNLASLSDPEWLVERTIAQLERSRERPFLGVVFFSTPHFPYVAPWPDYLRGAGSYEGPFLYHAPPVMGESPPTPEDVVQVRARYDGAVRSTDRAIARLVDRLRRDGRLDHTLLVVTADHGEELYEEPGIAGHGDTLGAERSQAVPILLRGPGVPAGRVRDDQVRLHDLGATILGLTGGRPGLEFGDGLDLLVEGAPRPACLETGICFSRACRWGCRVGG